MPAVDLVIQTQPPQTEEIEFVPNLDVLCESNRCACAASEDSTPRSRRAWTVARAEGTSTGCGRRGR